MKRKRGRLVKLRDRAATVKAAERRRDRKRARLAPEALTAREARKEANRRAAETGRKLAAESGARARPEAAPSKLLEAVLGRAARELRGKR